MQGQGLAHPGFGITGYFSLIVVGGRRAEVTLEPAGGEKQGGPPRPAVSVEIRSVQTGSQICMSRAELGLLEVVGGTAVAPRRRRRSVRYASRAGRSWRLLRCGLVCRQREEVEGPVPSRVESRDERECAPLKYLLDDRARLVLERRLGEDARLVKPRYFSHREQVALGDGECLLEDDHQRLVVREQRSTLGRPSPECLLMEPDHPVADLEHRPLTRRCGTGRG